VDRVPPTGYGGIEQVVDLLCRELVHRGHSVTLFAAPVLHTVHGPFTDATARFYARHGHKAARDLTVPSGRRPAAPRVARRGARTGAEADARAAA
jgi:hypothetical protein